MSSENVVRQKSNSLLKNISDEELVYLIQEDIDDYRMECSWVCPECGNKVSYLHSLYDKGNKTSYIHEYKCQNIIKKKRSKKICKAKMLLKNINNKKFASIYFDELFSRYQSDMIKESSINNYCDSFDDIYSALLQQFLKIVALFNRDKSMKKTSEKWFSSFFWKSVKNKIIDVKKSESHSKRNPQVECACCKKLVPYISPKHLDEDGHEEIWDKLYEDYGKILDQKDSEENNSVYFYINKGKKFISSLNESEIKKIFSDNCMRIYAELYPEYYTKNNIMSLDEPIDDDGNEIKDLISNNSSAELLDNIYISDIINFIMDNVFSEEKNLISLKYYFDKTFTLEEKRAVIFSILFDKVSYNNDIDNLELDKKYIGVNSGLTDEIFNIIRSNKECIDFISRECKI